MHGHACRSILTLDFDIPCVARCTQNGKSLAYMGFAQGKGGPHAGRDIDDPDHALRVLFQLEQAMLDDMWHSLDKGKVGYCMNR